MQMNTQDKMTFLIQEIKAMPASREMALVITKLEEAEMWYERAEKARKEKIAASGVGSRDVTR